MGMDASYRSTARSKLDTGEGANDRRQRLLYVTAEGEALALRLARLQTSRFARALSELGPDAHDVARRLLTAMIDVEDRDNVLRVISRADPARREARRGAHSAAARCLPEWMKSPMSMPFIAVYRPSI